MCLSETPGFALQFASVASLLWSVPLSARQSSDMFGKLSKLLQTCDKFGSFHLFCLRAQGAFRIVAPSYGLLLIRLKRMLVVGTANLPKEAPQVGYLREPCQL
jgi:hypothetical protein